MKYLKERHSEITQISLQSVLLFNDHYYSSISENVFKNYQTVAADHVTYAHI